MLSNIIMVKWYKFCSHIRWFGQDLKKNISPSILVLYDKNKAVANIEGGERRYFFLRLKSCLYKKKGTEGVE